MKSINSSREIRVLVLIVLLLSSASSSAYVGPGLGLGMIGVLLGGIVAILLVVGGIVWYPLKRLLKKPRDSSNDVEKSEPKVPEKENENSN